MKFLKSLPGKLLIGIVVGIIFGLFLPENVMTIVVTLKYVLNQLIMFCVPLIVIGFIALLAAVTSSFALFKAV